VEWLLALVAEQPDLTLDEIVAASSSPARMSLSTERRRTRLKRRGVAICRGMPGKLRDQQPALGK
jgi:hypothetical protein